MAKGKQNQGQQGGGGNNAPNKREDSISELVAARLLRFFSQIFGGWIATVPGLEETLKKAGGGNVVSMLEKAGTAFEIGFGGDEGERAVIGGFFTGLRDALKDVKDPGEASTKMEAFLGGPAAKALIEKKDVLGKQPLMSFAEALAAMSDGDDKKEIKGLITRLSDADLAAVMNRQATPARLHGLALIANARPSDEDAWKLLLTLPEPPKKGMDKATADAKKLVEAVQKLLDMLESESSGKTPKQLQAEMSLLRRQRQGMALLREGLRPQPRSVMWPMVAFTVVIALALWFVVSKLGS